MQLSPDVTAYVMAPSLLVVVVASATVRPGIEKAVVGDQVIVGVAKEIVMVAEAVPSR